MSAILLSIGCSAESSRPPLPAPPPAPLGSNAVSTANEVPASNPVPARVVSPCPPGLIASTSRPDSNQNEWSRTIDSIEVAELRTVQGKVCRLGLELRIQLLDGGTVVFKDDTARLSVSPVPRYAGYLKAIHSHAVHRVPYEGTGGYWVVDDSTGNSTIVLGMPVASPDGTRFVLTSMRGEADYDPGLIEVWRMIGRKPEKEFSFDTEQELWEPSDPVWRDSVTIDFQKLTHSSPGDPYVGTRGRLTRTGTTWILVDSLPRRP